ncbi:MAG TPA: cysteine desulfurase, partial [Rhodobacterales bacterium]|nr:cysteine desulfurase [Rhodobacterales bacterium]
MRITTKTRPRQTRTTASPVRARSYLDWNATAPLRPEARAAMLAAMDVVGNPSSVHAEGRAAKRLVETARRQVAAAVGCAPGEVVFTSGATEAAQVLRGYGAVWVDAAAHDALWAQRRTGGEAVGPTALALGLAGGETGIIVDLPTRDGDQWVLGDAQGDILLLDITQAVGRIPFAFSWSGADIAILSGHKLGGPKGVGALIVRQGLDIAPVQTGGGQEVSRRSGTENVIGITGFGAAIEAAQRDLEAGVWDRVSRIRNILEEMIAESANMTIFVGKDANRLPNTSCFITPGWKGETQVMVMDLAGFAVSAGSACSSGKVKASPVLQAMGYDAKAAASALRVSLGPETTRAEVLRFCEAWHRENEKL